MLEQRVNSLGYKQLNRFNDVTKLYADAVREIGDAHGVAVLDLWNAFMAEVGWKAGESLPGALNVAESPALKRLLIDGSTTCGAPNIPMLC